MSDTLSERRLAENEVFFRQENEKVQNGFDELNKLAKKQGQEPYAYDPRSLFQFYCECADEKCRGRVTLSLEAYNLIHKDKKAFVIICGHEVAKIEQVIEKTSEYCVVQKYNDPPQSAQKLNKTTVSRD